MRTLGIVPRGAVSDQSMRSLIPRAFAASRGRRARAVDATTGVHAGELDTDGLDGLAVEEAKASSPGGGSDLRPAA